MAKQSQPTISILASPVPELGTWGRLTVRLFEEIPRQAGLKPRNICDDQAWYWTEQ